MNRLHRLPEMGGDFAAARRKGQTFAANIPMPGNNADGTKPCPIDSKPLYRIYNNASAPGKDYVSNHRYVPERSDVAVAVAQGWVNEGQVMCVPQ